jgi:hypothetical protein
MSFSHGYRSFFSADLTIKPLESNRHPEPVSRKIFQYIYSAFGSSRYANDRIARPEDM